MWTEDLFKNVLSICLFSYFTQDAWLAEFMGLQAVGLMVSEKFIF